MKNKILSKMFLLKNSNSNIDIGKNVVILGRSPYIKIFEKSKLIIGDFVTINSDFKNSNTALTTICKFVLGYNGVLKVGNNTQLNGCSITAYESVTIGENCQFASSTLITDTDFHPIDPEIRKRQVTRQEYDFESVNKKSVVIGDNVWIGWGAIILKGSILGDNSIVAAGSIVTGEFPENVIIAGNPAKIVKEI